ncbi:MAG: polyketide beta-ketoacyl:ACP synthase [Lewinellaceae bacterium]|nr:polyketide beta-ketoacyl:ACP synthase [Lewinellaceae bacterium]
MSFLPPIDIAVTGMGVITPAGVGKGPFGDALKAGRSNFRALALEQGGQRFQYPAGLVDGFNFREAISRLSISPELAAKCQRMRNLSKSASFGLFCALEAWADAGLEEASPDMERVAIVSAGSNTQQAGLLAIQEKYREKLQFMPPTYGLNFFDTDLVGAISEILGVRGEGHSLGAASASGNMAIIQGCRLIQSGEYGLVLVVAPLMDLSIFEYQGFTSLGAMAELRAGDLPDAICRPFDEAHRGFVHGQSAGCLILESAEHAARRGQESCGHIIGYGVNMDANRNPNPSAAGERKAMAAAMASAGLSPEDIQYVNTHGTASPTGDQIEAEALLMAGLKGVKANSTKSLTGHGLSAAGLVECIATLIQMQEGFLHPNLNLQHPINDQINWIGPQAQKAEITYALSNSFAFGGLNTSIIINAIKQ